MSNQISSTEIKANLAEISSRTVRRCLVDEGPFDPRFIRKTQDSTNNVKVKF